MNDVEAKAALLQRVKILNIAHPRYREIWDELDSLRPEQGTDRDMITPRHLFIYGESGVGKSTLLRKYVKAKENIGYVDVDEEGTQYDIRPVVYTDLPEPFTKYEFYHQIVKALGAPQPGGSKIGDVKQQALKLIEQQRVEMVILDEMDYILTSRSVKQIEAMEAIKSLTNLGNISVVCAGTPAAKQLTEINFQYYSRFPAIPLPRFHDCDGGFCALLEHIEEHLGLPVTLGLGDRELHYPQLLHKMSQGVLRPLVQVLQRAFTIMLKKYDLDDLANHELFVDVLLSARKYVLGEDEDKFLELLNRSENYESK
ncbi:TniB family NTP-binding protein [Alicyclobacillus sp. SO9]|uniref:TniB family NTP-binding protein n=1 Tax=Alicyclobacillus sp. SO9 TaxID=2665646 RepID=UPI0018E6E1C9|nr:TniB family NTP-binding protein [Alicyclobacillus sp. SO9]QQE78385.1 TniB family NTP-binding protein [Alicyclobacillus sp. SO9]